MLSSVKSVVPSCLSQVRNMSGSNGLKLSGKVAVITASTDGIGFSIAERLSQDGAKVVISSRKEANVTKALALLKSKGHDSVVGTVCHVSKQQHRSALFKTAIDHFGKIDILVSNAAANPSFGSVFECSEEAWDKIFEVNVKSSFLLAKEVLPYMRENGSGAIVFVSSIAGYVPISLLGAYSVSKTALLGLTKVCATELASENIRVNCLAPGVIETKFSAAITGSEVAKEASLAMIPAGRFGKSEEMGAVVSFLCSDDASFITGETIVAAGGMISRL